MAPWVVTGASGFLGAHLCNALRDRGVPFVGLSRRGSVSLRVADLDDPAQIRRVLAAIRPAVVLHAAGRTPPSGAAELYRANTMATVHLLDALRDLGAPARVVLAGSAAELGPVPCDDLPVDEAYPCHPADAYGLSKLLATTAGLAARPPLDVMVARVFNPIGPELPASQAFGRFADQLCTDEPDPLVLSVGGLAARRDFIDIRDVARAFVAIAQHGQPGQLYHVGTGQSRAVGEGLDVLVRLTGRTVRLETHAGLASRPGPSDSRADISRIVAHTNWRPEIAFEQSLADLWRARSDDARMRSLPLTALPHHL